jgi:multiple sugar transport system permease protein
MRYAGLNNYRRLVFDDPFLKSLLLTFKFATYAILFQLVIGYLLANLLAIDFPGKSIFRVIHTIPLMIAPLAVGATWRLLTIPGFGPVPHYLDHWFDFEYSISANATQAFWTTVVMDVWHWTPFVTLTMLAGLVSLPKEPLEQALVDGANRLQVFWYIKVPLLRPIILSTVFIRLMDALRTVDEVWMLTGGGPAASTRYTGLYIWRIVFPKTDYGYGSAMSLLTLYFTIVISWLLYTSIGAQRRGER